MGRALRSRNLWIALGTAATLLAVPLVSSPARAQEPPAGQTQAPAEPGRRERAEETALKVFDAMVLRPVGLVGLVVGASLFVPAAIVSSPGGLAPIEEAAELFWWTPYRFVIERELGDF